MFQTAGDRQNRTLGAEAPIRTIYLFGVLTIVSMALVWANNEFVITKEALYALAGKPQNTVQLDMQYEAVRRMTLWGFAAAPFQTAFRIGFSALVVQMTCLLGGIEITYVKLFRISAVAFAATLFGSILQIFWIASQPAVAITKATLGFVPDSLAAWIGASSETPSLLYLLLSRASITSLLWMLLVYWGLRETNRLRIFGATAVTAISWLVLSCLQVGTSVFAQKLVG